MSYIALTNLTPHCLRVGKEDYPRKSAWIVLIGDNDLPYIGQWVELGPQGRHVALSSGELMPTYKFRAWTYAPPGGGRVRQDFKELPLERLLSEDGYPTLFTMGLIKNWNHEAVPELFDMLETLWKFKDYFHVEERDDGSKYYRISTAGWSGNEQLIAALEENWFVWSTCWQNSRRGGHYEFQVDVLG